MVKTHFLLFKVQSFASALAVVLFFAADRAGQSRICFWLQLCSVSLLVQKPIDSLKRRFLWCGKFHVVSLSSRFETTPDVSASKHIKFVVRKV